MTSTAKSKKILFPTDFSDAAQNAFEYTLQLAAEWGATVELLHVVYPQLEALDYPVFVSRATQELVDTSREVLQSFIAKGQAAVQGRLAGEVDLLTDIEVGLPERSIVEVARRDSIDLIVMGSRGENRTLVEKWLGSTSLGVIEKAHCPVMVIPLRAAYEKLRRIAYATDGHAADAFEIWESLQLFKAGPQVCIDLVHVNTKPRGDDQAWKRMEQVAEFLRSQTNAPQVELHHLAGRSIAEALNTYVGTHPVDCLVMYRAYHDVWDRLFRQSQTRRMAWKTQVPLLIQKEN
ncbi:MAG: universal stress protein [Bacteroidota bacterium]